MSCVCILELYPDFGAIMSNSIAHSSRRYSFKWLGLLVFRWGTFYLLLAGQLAAGASQHLSLVGRAGFLSTPI